MQTKDKVLLCAFGLCAICVLPFIILLGISLFSHMEVIGWIVTGFIILCIGCVSLLLVAFTFSRIGLWNAKRQRAINATNFVLVGDIVVYRLPGGEIRNLSADVEKARYLAGTKEVTGSLSAPRTLGRSYFDGKAQDNEEIILQLYGKGLTVKSIASSMGIAYEDVENIVQERG